ncbi:MAG: carboxypeptidase regulatory-like domain-containing protein, partial [Gemmatimonadota bacterium]|nr:carboxypeptidase regulatory-like domain-containing protein [Gemmatimonadota bacterium]
MSRITKLVAAATLLAVPLIQACGEGTTPPPPTGSFAGKVMIEGEGIDGVNVALSSGETVTTAGGGAYRFDDIEEGTYTITISGYPDDASFASASASATLRDDGQLVTVDFSGKWVRTAALLGSVTVEGNPIVGIMVKIAGMSESETLTGSGGQYSFTGLRKGDYTVQISDYDDEDIGFSSTVEPVELDIGQSLVQNFEGTYVRASSILVEVKIEGNGIEDVEVSVQGKGETYDKDTQGNGSVLFEALRKGEYVVVITNPDPDEYEFEETSQTIEVDFDDMEPVQFNGVELRTASIEGVITVDGHGPLGGVTVSVNGKGDDPDPVVTLGNGRFSFDRLYAGEYTVDIFGYDDDEYGFEVTSRTVTVARKETGTADFGGILLRTGAIAGEVTVKGEGLPDVTVTVSGGLKSETFTRNTNPQGMFEVDRLHQGDYTVTISGYDEREYGFEVTTKNVTVELRSTAPVAFDGILLRTAGVSGRVTIAGEPMSGVMVTLSGEEDRDPETTNDNGQYGFSGLAAGDYTITLSGYDAAEYEFDPSSVDFSLELDEAGIENFDGRSLRTVAVMGTVTAEGDPLEGVTARLLRVITGSAGDILGQMTTDGDGAYGFGNLLAATYGVEISGFDDEFKFPTTFQLRPVATDDTAMFHFDAQIIREASVSGMVSVDGEGMGGVMVMLTGDHDTDEEMETDSDGEYEFDGLRKGSYTVTIENPDADAYDF